MSLLLTTLLRPGKIVFAKLLAALRVSTVLTFLLTEQLLLAYFLVREFHFELWTLVVFLLIIATTCLATSTIGLMCSALSRRTSVAMVSTYMTLLALFVGPVGLVWYLQGFESISDRQLAALTITSPYSAALSVPLHLPKMGAGNYTSDTIQFAPTLLLPITSWLQLPVWAIFLAIYPPMCGIFWLIALLAFRWRWWRAGGT
jgi:ABC-type transport system involved in multi-copper enzyme maturation permease subunit